MLLKFSKVMNRIRISGYLPRCDATLRSNPDLIWSARGYCCLINRGSMLQIIAPFTWNGDATSSWSSSRTKDGADEDPSKVASNLVHSSSQFPGIRTALIPICCTPDDPQPSVMRILWGELGGEDDGCKSKGSSSTMVELRWVWSKNRAERRRG